MSADHDAHNKTMLLSRFHRMARHLRSIERRLIAEKLDRQGAIAAIATVREQLETDTERLHTVLNR